MNNLKENQKKITWGIVTFISIAILLFAIFRNFSSIPKAIDEVLDILSPLITGFIFALILNVPMRFFESHLWQKSKNKFLVKIRLGVSFLISLILILGIATGIIVLVLPELYSSIKIIIQGASDIIAKLQSSEKIEIADIPISDYIEKLNWDDLIVKAQDWLKNQSGNIVSNALTFITNFIGGIFNFVISFVFSIYIIFNKRKLKAQSTRILRAWLPCTVSEHIIHTFDVAGKNFRSFIAGQSLEAVILGTLCMLGMLVLRIPYAPMVGALVGITALVPVVGGFIGAGVGAFMILTINPIKAVVFIIFLIILQQLENNLIYPKVMGSQVDLPSIWILASVTVGGGFGGVLGMLLAVPIASTAYTLIKESTFKREEKILEEKLKEAEKETKVEEEKENEDSQNLN